MSGAGSPASSSSSLQCNVNEHWSSRRLLKLKMSITIETVRSDYSRLLHILVLYKRSVGSLHPPPYR